MSFLGILLLVPIFSISLVIYIMTLIDFIVTSNLDVILLIISLFLTLILSFFIFILLKKSFPYSMFTYKYANMSKIIYSFFSFILLFMFGITNLIVFFFVSKNYIELIGGLISISIVIYPTIKYILSYKDIILKLENISNLKPDIKSLKFYTSDGKILEYFTRSNTYKEGKYYLVKYNKYTSNINRIKKEVIDME